MIKREPQLRYPQVLSEVYTFKRKHHSSKLQSRPLGILLASQSQQLLDTAVKQNRRTKQTEPNMSITAIDIR